MERSYLKVWRDDAESMRNQRINKIFISQGTCW